MNKSIEIISFANLVLAFIPVMIVVIIVWKWKIGHGNSIYALGRMLIQLLLIGYFLTYIFESDDSWIVVGVLAIMLSFSSWIALRTIKIPRKKLYLKCFWSILLGGGAILLLITQGVLGLEPWYLPSYMVPLAGMIFANTMNSISLAGERLESELNQNIEYDRAKKTALHASLIPITNSLFAVGIVSLPGMMTGQILSGISPFIAARYQIMVMCMMFGSAGLSSAIFLVLTKADFVAQKD